MIGLDISEQEYRDMDNMSYSTLSGISRQGKDSLTDEFVPNYATKFGILTESLLFDDYNPDDYYVMPNNIIPTDKLKDACDIIFPKLIIDPKLDENLEKYKGNIKIILEHFDIDYYKNRTSESRASSIIKDTSEYWKHIKESKNKIVISQSMLEKCRAAAQTLRIHEFTKDIFATDSFFNIEKQSQVKLIFNYRGRKLKCMLDWLIIDHDNKVIKPYDLKTGSKPIEEFENSFYYWRYDIQAFLYTLAVIIFRNKHYPEYDVEDFRFVYISRLDVSRPIIYKVNSKIHLGSFKGFYRKGEYYKSVIKLIEEYEWYLSNEKAQYPKEVYENSGEILLADNIIINE